MSSDLIGHNVKGKLSAAASFVFSSKCSTLVCNKFGKQASWLYCAAIPIGCYANRSIMPPLPLQPNLPFKRWTRAPGPICFKPPSNCQKIPIECRKKMANVQIASIIHTCLFCAATRYLRGDSIW